jgi:hypothetical protein
MIEDLVADMKLAIDELDRWPERRRIELFHHNDSDGLSAAAILTRALTRAGPEVHRCCLEKPYPVVLEQVFHEENQGRVLVFADFAGRIAPLISELNRSRNLVLILDHHKAEPASDPRVHNLDPELFGLAGDRDMSASTTCYLFACTLDPRNCDLAPIATIGAVGDHFLVDGCLAGANREVAEEAKHQGRLSIERHEAGEHYTLLNPGGPIPCAALAEDLDTLGAAGYYQDGPEIGVKVCLDGPSSRSVGLLAELRAIQERAFTGELARIRRDGLSTTAHLQWLHVEDRFAPMGVKMIGAFLDTIRNSGDIDPDRYLAGFQLVPNQIPGFGEVALDQVKISMRVADQLGERIRAGQAPGLDTFLPAATSRLGGFSDACHSLSAATTVAIGREQRLIEEIEAVLADTERSSR